MTAFRLPITAAVCASLLAGSLAVSTTSADARDMRGYHGYNRGGYEHSYRSRSDYRRHARPSYGYRDHRRHESNRRGKRIAKGIAIGVGALILGSILANEARRR